MPANLPVPTREVPFRSDPRWRTEMPFITVRLITGRTQEQKDELARRITTDVQEVLQTRAESVWLTFEEIPASEWFIAGESLAPRS